MSGMISGIAQATHQQNLLDLQNRVSGNQMMGSHLLQLSQDPHMLPEARSRSLQGAMEIFGDLGKDHKKTIGGALSDMANIHVQQGTPSWDIADTAARAAPPQTVGAPTPIPGAAQQMQVPPPGLPPDITHGMYYTPGEEAQMGASAAGLHAGAVSQAELPAKLEAERMKIEADYRNKLNQFIVGMAEHGFKAGFDPASGTMTATPMTRDELPIPVQTTVAKNEAGTKRILGQADLDKYKQQLVQAQTAFQNFKSNPASPMYQKTLTDIWATKQRIALAEQGMGLRHADHLARYFGVDENGKPIPGAAIDPDTGLPVGTAFQRSFLPTAATMTKAQTADPVMSQAKDLIDFARDPANEDLFGKIGGRWTDVMAGKIGTDDARMAVLQPKIRSLASLLAPLHGFRSTHAAQDFVQTMLTQDSPEAFASAVREYSEVARRIRDAAKPNTAKAGAPNAPPEHSVTYQNKKYTFQTPQQLDSFKREVGIQ
jgi:hypothetical protein